MTKIDVFFDTNVLVYLFCDSGEKADRSEALIAAGGMVSVQVLNECASAMRRKFNASWQQVYDMSQSIRSNCTLAPLTEDIHLRGLAIAERYKLNVYDAMIVAAAQLADCRILYSEDMQDGFVIDDLTIRNPYGGP